MDSVTALASRPQDTATPAPTVTIEANRALAVTVTYRLSEEGRKASLLAGGDGRAMQELIVQVPANRLHLVSVDVNGVARLKLRPRFEMNGDQQLVRIDTPPAYDAPPDIEDLFREAAKNHQLEQVFEAERRSAKTKRREADQERRAELAHTFLNDPAMRALVHPAPTPKRCYIITDRGRVLFDVATDAAPARDVPPEAHRRFRADLRSSREENLRRRAEQLALHEEKKRFIADWIAAQGTPDQQARHAAGVLPMEEAVEAMTDQALASLAEWPRYQHDGVERLQQHVRQLHHAADAVITRNDLVVTSANAKEMTALQWVRVQNIQQAVPDASVTLRVHKLAWKRDPTVSLPPIVALLVTTRVGPFLVRREYATPQS
ncbi:MAG: hypothetical protein AB7I50_20875 [Vicinamibacterales bacterium]